MTDIAITEYNENGVEEFFGPYHYQYPIESQDEWKETAITRAMPIPTPQDVVSFVFMGIQHYAPHIAKALFNKDAQAMADQIKEYLIYAIGDVEATLSTTITPTKFMQSMDSYPGQLDTNYLGCILNHWPAYRVDKVAYRFPHAMTSSPIHSLVIPSEWIILKNNNINVTVSTGILRTELSQNWGTSAVSAPYGFLARSFNSMWRPSAIQIIYWAGFPENKIPPPLRELILVVAAEKLLSDWAMALFPVSGTSVSIDGVSQSSSLTGPTALVQRLQMLQQRKADLTEKLFGMFGRQINAQYFGC